MVDSGKDEAYQLHVDTEHLLGLGRGAYQVVSVYCGINLHYIVFSAPDVADIVSDILKWIRGKDVFVDEDCSYANFRYVCR